VNLRCAHCHEELDFTFGRLTSEEETPLYVYRCKACEKQSKLRRAAAWVEKKKRQYKKRPKPETT